MKKNNFGMTLTEVMIVVSIIALMTSAFAVFTRLQLFKAHDTRRKAEIKGISIAVEEYEKDNNCYPLSNLVVCQPGTGLLPYINKISCDPVLDSSYLYEQENSICPRWYRIYSVLGNKFDVDYQPNIGPNGAFNYVYESPNAPTGITGTYTASSEAFIPGDEFYACYSGVCTQIFINPVSSLPECLPNWSNRDDCYNQCVNPDNQCAPQ